MNYDIEMSQIQVLYGSDTALQDISLKLPSGKIYGLLGRNGAGKTTLLSLLGSFIEPTAGRLTIGGQHVFENAEVMSQVTFVYEGDDSEETDNLKELLEFAERYRPTFDREYADYLTKRYQLPTGKKIKDMSKGQRSAVKITIGLANRSPITIFDEAYLGMDAPSREIFYRELVEDHARHPRTIILSTHHVSEVDYLFEDVIILHQGRVLLHEPMDQLLERGVSVIGAAQAVDQFSGNLKVLHTEQLGGTKKSMIYGKLTNEQVQEAARLKLEIDTVSLQQLFIYLTEEGNQDEYVR